MLERSLDALLCFNGGSRRKGELWSEKINEDKWTLDQIQKHAGETVVKCHGDKIQETSAIVRDALEKLKAHIKVVGVIDFENKAEFQVVLKAETALRRAQATEFESRACANWDVQGAGRTKSFEKIVIKLIQGAGKELEAVQSMIVPCVLKMAFDAAGRELNGQLIGKKQQKVVLSGAPVTPSMPSSAAQPPTLKKEKKSDKQGKSKSKDKDKKEDHQVKEKKKKTKAKKCRSSDSSSD